MTDHPTDEELTIAIENSDLRAFQVSHKGYLQSLFRFVCGRASEETARDLIQDLFLRVWDMRKRLDPRKPIKPFLYRLATNISIDHFRRSRKERHHISLHHGGDLLVYSAEDNDLILTIRNAIEELPDSLRLTFSRTFFMPDFTAVLNLSLEIN